MVIGFLVDICKGYKSFIRGGSANFLVEFQTLGMDKSQIKESRLSKEYEDEVDLFLKFVIDNSIDPNMIPCPFTKCGNFQKLKKVDMKSYLFSYGIDTLYEKWIWHGEIPPSIGSSHKRARIKKVCDEYEDDHLTDMFNNIEDRFVDHLDELIKML